MENKEIVKSKLSAGKIILIIILILLIGVGLFGAGCGGFFLFGEFFYDTGGYSFYIISVPSLLIGLLFIFIGHKGIKKILKSRNIGNENIEENNIEKLERIEKVEKREY